MKRGLTAGLRIAAMAVCLMLVAGQASALLQHLEVKDPRRFGYWIGDVVSREATIVMEAPYVLEQQSLPRPGRMDMWLWLRRVDVEAESRSGRNSYRLTFDYQVLTAPPLLQRINIPQQTVYFSGEGERLPVLIESLGVYVSPLAAPSAAADAGFPDIYPAVPPPPLDTARHIYMLTAAIGGVLLAAVVLLYVYGSVPWLGRSQGPFNRALAALRPLARGRPTEESVAQAFRCLHHAFDTTAGEVLLSRDLPGFFQRFPGFRTRQRHIETFYLGSRQWFYEPERAAGAPAEQLRQLMDLCRACRDIERGLA